MTYIFTTELFLFFGKFHAEEKNKFFGDNIYYYKQQYGSS